MLATVSFVPENIAVEIPNPICICLFIKKKNDLFWLCSDKHFVKRVCRQCYTKNQFIKTKDYPKYHNCT